MVSPIQKVGSVSGTGRDFYIVSFRKIEFGHQEDVYFLDVEKYFGIFQLLGQPICIPQCYVIYVNYFTSLLSKVVRIFMKAFICSVCLVKIVSNRVKNSSISLINMLSFVLFAEIFVVSILFLIAWAYMISDLPSVYCSAAWLSSSCLGVFVK